MEAILDKISKIDNVKMLIIQWMLWESFTEIE